MGNAVFIDTSQVNLLIVDDPRSRETLLRVFGSLSRVTSVDYGPAALDALAASSFDAVLLAADMAGVNGLTLLKMIRNRWNRTALPVILICSEDSREVIMDGLEIGANDYLIRPLDVDLAVARVAAQIELKRAVDERDRTIKKLSERQETQDRLMRMATHDLKHPMTNIRMAETMLRRQLVDNPDGTKIIDSVLLALDSIDETVADLQDAFLLEEGISLDLKRVAVEAVLYHVALQYEASAAQKDIQLKVTGGDGWIMTDRRRLAQIISNMLSNAIKYSPPGTEIRVWSNCDEDAIRIAVADQGPGIPDDERHLLFTEFGKLSTRPTGEEISVGLGLWITRNLAEMLGGVVGVDQPADGGSIFWADFPAYRPEAPEHSQGEATLTLE